jgi:DNA-binding XRE family transcriptional regulator
MHKDVIDYVRAKARLRHNADKISAKEVSRRKMSGRKHPLRVWRESRGYTQEQLSALADVPLKSITEIEAGIQHGDTLELRSLAGVLNVHLEDLVTDVSRK